MYELYLNVKLRQHCSVVALYFLYITKKPIH